VKIGSRPATAVDLFGPAENPQRGILGAIVPDGGQWWFIKLSGDVEAVRAQQEPFAAFLDSIRLPGDTSDDESTDQGEGNSKTGDPKPDNVDKGEPAKSAPESATSPEDNNGPAPVEQIPADVAPSAAAATGREDEVPSDAKDPGNGQ
jgi:hypothetical protein